jgi:hypothetical protein
MLCHCVVPVRAVQCKSISKMNQQQQQQHLNMDQMTTELDFAAVLNQLAQQLFKRVYKKSIQLQLPNQQQYSNKDTYFFTELAILSFLISAYITKLVEDQHISSSFSYLQLCIEERNFIEVEKNTQIKKTKTNKEEEEKEEYISVGRRYMTSIQQHIMEVLSDIHSSGSGAIEHILKACANCGIDSASASKNTKKCSSCHQAHYCSQECQKQHWVVHRVLCPIQQYISGKTNKLPSVDERLTMSTKN